jgi:hypothetical protein
MDMDKDKELLKTKRQFNKILKQVPEDRKPIAEKLIKEITFMAKTLDELREQIEEGGTVELFKQGNQEFLRESPALKGYNTTVQRYSLLYKQLTDLLPKSAQDNKENALYEFIKQG